MSCALLCAFNLKTNDSVKEKRKKCQRKEKKEIITENVLKLS